MSYSSNIGLTLLLNFLVVTGATVTVLLPIFSGHITVDHISCLKWQNRAKPIGSSWVAQILELVYTLVVLLYFLIPVLCHMVYAADEF